MLVRSHLIPPAHTTQSPSSVQLGGVGIGVRGFFLQVLGIKGRPGGWILGNRLVDAAGRAVTRLPSACVKPLGGSSGDFSSCLAKHGLKIAVTYEPASRYWALQSAETALYLVLAAGLVAFCYRRVRRPGSA
jgi:hypothetical protein